MSLSLTRDRFCSQCQFGEYFSARGSTLSSLLRNRHQCPAGASNPFISKSERVLEIPYLNGNRPSVSLLIPDTCSVSNVVCTFGLTKLSSRLRRRMLRVSRRVSSCICRMFKIALDESSEYCQGMSLCHDLKQGFQLPASSAIHVAAGTYPRINFPYCKMIESLDIGYNWRSRILFKPPALPFRSWNVTFGVV